MPLSSSARQMLNKMGTFAKSEIKGTLNNIKEGLKANLDPRVKGGLSNTMEQMRNIIKKK